VEEPSAVFRERAPDRIKTGTRLFRPEKMVGRLRYRDIV
jgi:hypothetical protein